MISHQCRFCPWDCPSPETAPCNETDHTPMAAEPCDFPPGPLPTQELVEDALRRTSSKRKVRSYRNVLRDLSDWRPDA